MYGRRRLLAASVISIQNANFVYPSCQSCLSRLLLDSERYSCLRCGRSGDAKDTNYRYRLSLEVADAHEVFEVTVFGSCLDAYFGVTAKGLQRYIEELKQEAGEPDTVASSSALVEAVETCFVGKKFVFGVKDSVKHNDASSLQSVCQADGHPRALTACQMFVPNPQFVGCTVLQYLQQHQSVQLGHSPIGQFIALDQNLEHISLQGSGSLREILPGCLDGLSSLWPQSFGLTSSSTPGGTPVDPVAPSPSWTTYEKPKGGANLISSYSLSSQSHDIARINQNTQQDKKLHPFSAWGKNFPAKGASESQSSLREKGCSSLEGSCKIHGSHSRDPEKSWNTLPFQKQGDSFGPLVASCTGIGGSSQEALWFGDELPSSESLSEFIAQLESNQVSKSPPEHCPSQGSNGHSPNQIFPKVGVFQGTLLTGQPDEKLQKLTEKVWKEGCLHRPLNLSPFKGNKSHSPTRKEGWRDLPSEQSVSSLWSSSAGDHPHSKGSCQPSTEDNDQDGGGSKDLQVCSSFESIKKTNLLNCKHNSNFPHTGSSSHQLHQTTNIADTQKGSFTLVSHEKLGEIHESDREPLPEVQAHDSRGRNTTGCLLQGDSEYPQGSYGYDASADLFDCSASEVPTGTSGVPTGTSEAVQTFLEKEGMLTEKHLVPELWSTELDAHWSISPCRLSLSAPSDPQTSTPVAPSGAESEGSLVGTSDFVPYSQATPFAKQCQQVQLHRGSESILSELQLNKLSWINARCRRPRHALEKSLRRQCLSKFLPSRGVNNACPTAGNVDDQNSLSASGSPVQKLFDNDSEDWIPPSERKGVHQLASHNQKVFGLRKRRIPIRNFTGDQIITKSPLSENGSGGVTAFTPQKVAPVAAVTIPEDCTGLRHQMGSPPGFCASASQSVPNATIWSPLLFAD